MVMYIPASALMKPFSVVKSSSAGTSVFGATSSQSEQEERENRPVRPAISMFMVFFMFLLSLYGICYLNIIDNESVYERANG